MGILTEGATPTKRATEVQLQAWSGKAMAPYTLTLDSEAPQTPMEDEFSLERDSYIIVDLKTMKIVEIYQQDVDGALQKLAELVGP